MNNRKLVSIIAVAVIVFGYGVGVASAQSDASVMNARKLIEQGKIPFTLQEFNFYAVATFCPVGCDFVVSNPAFPQKIVALQGSTLLPGNQLTPAKLDSVFRPVYFNSYCSSELPNRGISFAVNVKDNAGGYYPWILDSSVCPAPKPKPTPTSTPITGVNVALGKPATQRSNIGGGYGPTEGLAALAVDGNTDGRWAGRSVTHTAAARSLDPWWEVDLGADYDVNTIQIWNRTDCCSQELSNYRIWTKAATGGWVEFIPGLKTYTQGETNPRTFTGSKQARYVRVIIESPSATLMLAEVKVFGTPAGPIDNAPQTSAVNLALGKPATQSTNMSAQWVGWGLASLAVDGNIDGDFFKKSVASTDGNKFDAWWEVDLGTDYNVNKIQIWNRTDCCTGRLTNYQIWTKTLAGGWEEFTPGLKTYQPGETYPLTFSGSNRSRIVRVQISGAGILALAEVKVFGTPAGPIDNAPQTSAVNLALGKPATQSTNLSAPYVGLGLASLAVDGNTDGHFFTNKSVASTDAGKSDPWWEVDLGTDYNVNKIQIWNRTDCCREKLTNYRIWTKTEAGGWEEFAPGLKTYQPGETYPLTFSGSNRARFVRVAIVGGEFLGLAEVKVFGTPVGPVANPTPAPTPTTAPTPATGDGKAASPEEELLWAEVVRKDTVTAYQTYLKEYKNGKYAITAQTRINLSSDPSVKPDTTPTNVNTAKTDEDQFWDEVEKNDSVIAYQAYIDKYPLGKYVGKALLRKQLKSGISATPTPAPIATPTPLPKVSADDEFWNKIKDSNRVEDFEVYLQAFPNDANHKADAMLNISRLKPEKKAPEPEEPIKCTVTGVANLRDDSKKKILGILKRGRVVVSIEQDGDWERVGEIRNGNIISLGWVSVKLLTCEGDEP